MGIFDRDGDCPAFPQHAATGNLEGWRHGLTARDYFAAQILPAVYAAGVANGFCDQDAMAKEAYELADAMLEARAQEPPK